MSEREYRPEADRTEMPEKTPSARRFSGPSTRRTMPASSSRITTATRWCMSISRMSRGTRTFGVATRKFAVSVVLLALLAQPSYAQQFPESNRQKTQEERKKADEKATDEAYKGLMKRLPDSNKKVDPWGGLRPPSATPGK
jgi:hypothetical protein